MMAGRRCHFSSQKFAQSLKKNKKVKTIFLKSPSPFWFGGFFEFLSGASLREKVSEPLGDFVQTHKVSELVKSPKFRRNYTHTTTEPYRGPLPNRFFSRFFKENSLKNLLIC